MNAFDLKDLEARLKAKGLVAVEGLAKIVTTEVFGWLNDSCVASSNVMVKAIGPAAVAILEPLALGAVDKIDGVSGN